MKADWNLSIESTNQPFFFDFVLTDCERLVEGLAEG